LQDINASTEVIANVSLNLQEVLERPDPPRAPLFAQNYPALPDHTVEVGGSQTVSIDNGTNKRSATQVGFNQLSIPEISPIETDIEYFPNVIIQCQCIQ
jgi:hypothetical protein